MPIFSQESKQKDKDQSNTVNEDSEKKLDEELQTDQAKSEEFNILNNWINKILSNLEVKVQNIAIRLLTKEINDDSIEIPTFLLRVPLLDYRRNQDCPQQQLVPNSDLQVILEGKRLDIAEISLHLMKNFNLHPDQNGNDVKNSYINKLKFPFEYPLLHDSCTILVIKPILFNIQQQVSKSTDLQNSQQLSPQLVSAISVKFDFSSKISNQLQVALIIHNFEVMLSLKQLGDISSFINNVVESLKKDQDCEQVNENLMESDDVDDEMIDLYGTIVKTNGNFKDLKKQKLPSMIKSRSVTIQANKKKLSQKKSKPFFGKSYLIKKFISKGIKEEGQNKNQPEIQGLLSQNQDLKQNNENELFKSLRLSTSESIQITQQNENKKLSVLISFSLNKASILIVCNQTPLSYDRIFDCLSPLLMPPPLNSQITVQQMQQIDKVYQEYNIKRTSHYVGFSYYNLEIRKFFLELSQTNKYIDQTQKNKNPFDFGIQNKVEEKKGEKKVLKQLQIECFLSKFEINRYQISDSPQNSNDSVQQLSQNQIMQNSFSQSLYESSQQKNSMFESAVEFYKLDETKVYKSTNSQKRHQTIDQSQIVSQNDIIYSPLTFSNYIINHVYLQNSDYQQHYCSDQTSLLNIIDLPPLSQNQKTESIFQFKGFLCEEDASKYKFKGKGRVGGIQIQVQQNDVLFILQMIKVLSSPQFEDKKEKNNKSTTSISFEMFEIELMDIRLEVGSLLNSKDSSLIVKLLQNKHIENILSLECVCLNEKIQKEGMSVIVQISNPKIKLLNGTTLNFYSDSLEVNLQNKGKKLPLLIASKIIVSLAQKGRIIQNQDLLQSTIRKMKAKVIFEDKEFSSSSSSEEEEDDVIIDQQLQQEEEKQYSRTNKSPKIQIKVYIEQITIDFDIQEFSSVLDYALQLEKEVKLLLVAIDIIKCQSLDLQQLDKSYIQNQINDSDRAIMKDAISQPIQLQVIIDDFQLIIKDSANNSKKDNHSLFQPISNSLLIKLRVNKVNFFLQFSENQWKQIIKIELSIEDAFLLDYTQPLINFHHEYLKNSKQIIIIQKNNSNYLAPPQSTFEEEIQISQPFIVFYKQQGLFEKYQQNPKLIQVKINLTIPLIKKFKEIMSIEIIETIIQISQSTTQNQILQVYEDLDLLKKNPFIGEINVTLQGLIVKLTFQYEQAQKIISSLKAQAVQKLKQQRISPIVNDVLKLKKPQNQFQLQIYLSDFAIDYTPIANQKLYEYVFGTADNNQKDSKYFAISNRLNTYLCPLRCVFNLSEIKLQVSELVQKGDMFNQIEKTLLVTAKSASINILNQSSYIPSMNPLLLLSPDSTLNQIGGHSLLDQLGFIEIFVIDHLELKNQTFEPEQTEQNDQGKDQNEVDIEEDEDDLFATSYGAQTMIEEKKNEKKKQSKEKTQYLTAFINKVSVFFAKDSYKSMWKIIQITDYNIKKLQKKKKGLISKIEKQKNIKLAFEEFENQNQDEYFQNIIEEFLMMELQKSLQNQSNAESIQLSVIDTIQEESKEGGKSKKKLNQTSFEDQMFFAEKEDQILNSEDLDFNLNAYLIEQYIPDFNEKDINETRHRQCHILPKDQQKMKVQQKIYVEINSIDLKMYDGLDFDFDYEEKIDTKESKQNQKSFYDSSMKKSALDSSLLSQSVYEPKSSIKAKNEKHKMYGFQEDYMSDDTQQISQSFFKNISILKRKRITQRGNFLQVLIKNPIISKHQLIECDKDTLQISRISFSCKELMIKETISKNGVARFLIELPFQYQFDNQIQFMMQTDEHLNFSETDIKAKIQTFKMLLNQQLFSFIQTFFDFSFNPQKSSKQTQKDPQQNNSNLQSQQQNASTISDQSVSLSTFKPEYIRSLKVNEFKAILSYTSKQLNLYDLRAGNMIELLNIFNINELKLQIKNYDLQQRMKKEEAIKHLIGFYINDLVNNQRISFIKAIGPIKSFSRMVGAFYGLFDKPYQNFMKDKSIIAGVGQGFYGLINVFSGEAVALTNKVILNFLIFSQQIFEGVKKDGDKKN